MYCSRMTIYQILIKIKCSPTCSGLTWKMSSNFTNRIVETYNFGATKTASFFLRDIDRASSKGAQEADNSWRQEISPKRNHKPQIKRKYKSQIRNITVTPKKSLLLFCPTNPRVQISHVVIHFYLVICGGLVTALDDIAVGLLHFLPAYGLTTIFDAGMTISAVTAAPRFTPGGKNSTEFTDPLDGALFLPPLGPSCGFGGSGGTASPAAVAGTESVRQTGSKARGESGRGARARRREGRHGVGRRRAAAHRRCGSAGGGVQPTRAINCYTHALKLVSIAILEIVHVFMEKDLEAMIIHGERCEDCYMFQGVLPSSNIISSSPHDPKEKLAKEHPVDLRPAQDGLHLGDPGLHQPVPIS
ncbi:hypothetical protein ABZP36_033471 [Zizania latifolia]